RQVLTVRLEDLHALLWHCGPRSSHWAHSPPTSVGLDVVSRHGLVSPGQPSCYWWSSINPHANSLFPKPPCFCLFPYGLAVRIPGFHPGGPGSTPGMGSSFRFPSAYAPSHEPHNKPTVCFQLPGLFLI